MPKLLNLAGKIFGRWSVIKYHSEKILPSKQKLHYWLCLCECGTVKPVCGPSLRAGLSKSCGCLNSELVASRNTTHDKSLSREHRIWRGMIQRCTNENNPAYPNYGGDGVTVCDHWINSFENFLEDMGECPDGMSLNRKQCSKIYSKETCEWANRTLQNYDQGIRSSNKSGKTGVYWDKLRCKWVSNLKKDGKLVFHKTFDDIEKAIEARRLAEIEFYGFIKE